MLPLTVVICTYQRADILGRALLSLCRQSADPAQFEVLVVTNSSDHSEQVVAAYQGGRHAVRYLFDPRPGLSNARNAGWQAANGRYVGYIDDDCRLPDHWVAVALKLIDELAPGAFGGPILPTYEQPRPAWFRDEYVIHRPFEARRVLHGEQEVTRIFGGNAVFRRDLLKAVGGFDPQISMVGDKISFGEDTKLLLALHRQFADEPIVYDPDLWLYHLVRPQTLTWRYNLPATFEGGRVQFRQRQQRQPALRSRRTLARKTLRTLLGLAVDLLRAPMRRDRRLYPRLRSYLFAHTLGYVRRLGSLYAEFEALRAGSGQS